MFKYSDTNWASDPIDRCSTIGYCFFLEDLLIAWQSKKQTLTTWFITKVEYHALVDITIKLLWPCWLLVDTGVSHSSSPLYFDNRSAIQIAHNDVFHKRTKRAENDYHFIRQHLVNGIIWRIFIHSNDQTVNIFTKSHLSGRFHDLISKLKLVPTVPPWVWGRVLA